MGYLDEGRYDYISGSQAAYDNHSSATLTGTGTSLTWPHTAGGTDRLVLVAIAWLEATGQDTLQGVTYGGIGMTRLATVGNLDVFYKTDPPTGSKDIVATWVGTHAKGVVAGAVSCQGVDPTTPLGTAATAGATGTTPAVTLYGTLHSGLVFSAVGVLAQSATTSLHPAEGSELTERWSLHAGSVPTLTLVQGAGGTRAGGGVEASPSNDLALAWALGASHPWNTLAIEAQPLAVKLVIDAEGSAFSHSPFGINALDYQDLQDAVDDVPAGGTVLIPAGTYSLDSVPRFTPPLKLPPGLAIHVLGAGPETTTLLVQDPHSESGHWAIQITADNQTVEGLSIRAPVVPQLPTDFVGIRVARPSIGSVLFNVAVRNCNISSIPSRALQIDDPSAVVYGTYENVSIDAYLGTGYPTGGIYIAPGTAGTTTQFFRNVRVAHFTGNAVQIKHGVTSVSFRDCIFEDVFSGNQAGVDIEGANQVLLDHCYFEFCGNPCIDVHDDSGGFYYGLVIRDCFFKAIADETIINLDYS